MRRKKPRHQEPLSAAVLHVLLALSEGPQHGYAVMRRVEEESGRVTGPGTVYGSLHRLCELGWVKEAGPDATDARRRSRYALTARGRAVLKAEALRLTRLASLARERGLVAQEGR